MGALKYNGTEKAAILLMGLGQDLAAEIFRSLSEVEIKRIGAAMQRLRHVDQNTFQSVLKEFYQHLNSPMTARLESGTEFLQSALEKAFKGERGEKIISEVVKGDARLEAVDLVDGETLAKIIHKEHPQTIAIILAHLDPKKCGDTLKHLPGNNRTELLMRLANLGPVAPEHIEEIDDHLKQEIAGMTMTGKKKLGGVDKVAAILNAIDRGNEKEILAQIGDRDPHLEEEIRAHMFVFDDLSRLEDRDMQTLIKSVAQDKWLLALRTAGESVRALVFKNMSERAAKLLQEDMQAMGRVKVTDVEAAQQQILAVAKQLEEQGKISLAQNKEEYV